MSTLISIAEVLLGIISFMLIWVIYPLSFSMFELYRVSILAIFFNRLFFSLLAGLIGYLIALFYFEPDQLKKFEQKTTIKTPEAEIENKNIIPIIRSESSPVIKEVENTTPELTDEQLEEAENNAQYHGDDPIIRKRLGLPPKRAKKEPIDE